MMKYLLTRLPALLLASIVGLMAASSAFGTATIVILNADQPGVGFNDPTPVAPVGGNTGTTLGEQRMIAFQAAANIWGATLVSGPTITIRASWPNGPADDPNVSNRALPCTQTTATLATAGNSGSIWRDFPNATFPGTWYGNALTNALRNTDSNGADPEINARFNVNLGTPGCFENGPWYYGLDNNHGSKTDLIAVALHEFGHGLGFQTYTSSSTGAQAGSPSGFPTIYDRFLLDNTTGEKWSDAGMTDAERVASAINTGNLVWNGTQVTGDATILAGGKDAQGHPLMFAPNPVSAGSSVSHWDSSAFPNQLMEPNNSSSLGHGVTVADSPPDLTFSLMRDIGWCAGCPQPPPPSPTPTPSPPPNDNFANAQVIGGCSGTVNGTNVAATEEAGEPDNPVSLGSTKSVWYRWQAPSTGSVTIDTIGSNYDTILGVYTGTAVNGLTLVGGLGVGFNDDIASGNTASRVTFNATAGTTYRIAVDGFENTAGSGGDTGTITLNWTESPCSQANTIQLSAANYSVGEGARSAQITVTRTNTTGAATVAYRTIDTDTFTVGCADKVNNQGGAYGRCDFATVVSTLSFAAGESSKNFLVPIIDDSWAEGNETFSVVLSNPTGVTLGSPSTATVTINDNDGSSDGPNPILATSDAGIAFFVRQHYLDFLGREPEAGEPWSKILRDCNPNQFNTDPNSPSAQCDRVFVSGQFFGSPEFKFKGGYVFGFYPLSFNRLPTYPEFVVDLASVSGATAAEVFAKRAAFADAFVQRPAFVTQYGGLTNTNYVNALMGHYGLSSIKTPDPANPEGATPVTLTTTDLINRLNGIGGTLTRAQVLRAIAQSDQATSVEALNLFVASQYYGYLRRAPEEPGFTAWKNYLIAHPTDFRTMVNGFVNSIEYRRRFGPA